MLEKIDTLRDRWRRVWLWTPAFAIAAVVLAIAAFDLAFGGADAEEPENLAPPAPGVAAPTPRPRTAAPPAATSTATAMPTPTVEPGPAAQMRDTTRKRDLQEIEDALERYYRKKKEYPSTSGNVQTACKYSDIDALCKLKDFLDPIPTDPVGDPGENGYWYASDGKTYMVIAAMELAENASPTACPEIVVDFVERGNLLCIAGP